MSRRVGGITIIEPTAPSTCELCGAFDELRPYGPHGENICFDCGMKDEKTTKRKMNAALFGEHEA